MQHTTHPAVVVVVEQPQALVATAVAVVDLQQAFLVVQVIRDFPGETGVLVQTTRIAQAGAAVDLAKTEQTRLPDRGAKAATV